MNRGSFLRRMASAVVGVGMLGSELFARKESGGFVVDDVRVWIGEYIPGDMVGYHNGVPTYHLSQWDAMVDDAFSQRWSVSQWEES